MRFSTILGLAATVTSAFAFVDHNNIRTRDVAGLYDRDIEDGYQLYARDPEDSEDSFVRDLDDLNKVYARDYNQLLARVIFGKKTQAGGSKAQAGGGKAQGWVDEKPDYTHVSSNGRKGKGEDAPYGGTGIKKTTTVDKTYEPNPDHKGKTRARRDIYLVDGLLGYDY